MTSRLWIVSTTATSWIVAVAATASPPPTSPSTSLNLGSLTPLYVGRLQVGGEESSAATATKAFGEANSWRANLLGGVISNFGSTTGGEFRAEFEYFMIERLSIVPVAQVGGFVQDGGGDPLMVGGSVLLRWHFLAGEDWTVFVDGGCGLAYLTEDLPPNTNAWKFDPQIGGGFTLAVGGDARLMGGVRWFHFSNARTASSNEGFDGAELYLGLSVPF